MIDNWTYWGGGMRPVPFDALVDYQLRSGPQHVEGTEAGRLCWLHTGGDEDILAYRPHESS